MVTPSQPKTLLEIIHVEWRAQGGAGPPPLEFIRAWRARHPAYDRFALDVRFYSGSTLPVRPFDHLDRATRAWLASGRSLEGATEEFDAFLETYCDEYDVENAP